MPSPVFCVRLPRKDREALDQMAKVCGAPSSGGFVAEMVRVMCSGDVDTVKSFVARLIQRHGEQLTLNLHGALDRSLSGRSVSEPAKKVERRPRKRGRRK